MDFFPVFLAMRDQRIAVSGAGEPAVAKLRLLLKTSAAIDVYGESPDEVVKGWAREGRLRLFERPLSPTDLLGGSAAQPSPTAASGGASAGSCVPLRAAGKVRLLYVADADPARAEAVCALARDVGVLTGVVDDLARSEFITPAIIDRDPVTVAIGTEGTAPVLARRIKAGIEELLHGELGVLAGIAREFRTHARRLHGSKRRRRFWEEFFDRAGPDAMRRGGPDQVREALSRLLRLHQRPSTPAGRVSLVGAGPGDPELLTLKARRLLAGADVVVHDRLVSPAILDLARREARFIDVGKRPGAPSCPQSEINRTLIEHAVDGAHVVRLKSGDPGMFGRLEEELHALRAAGVECDIVPGITAAVAAAAAAGASMTERGRNSSVRFLTGHDVDGFAEHDWRALARPGAVTAVYMGLAAARFVQSRLLIHGADAGTPVTVVENVSRPDQVVIATTLGRLAPDIDRANVTGPAVMLLGLKVGAQIDRSIRSIVDTRQQVAS